MKTSDPKPNLLIVDDDDDIRTQMKWALTDDYTVTIAEDRPAAVEAFEASRPDVVLLDLGLPPNPGDTTEGMAALADLLTLNGAAKVIIITGQGDKKHALKAVGEGAYDFLSKPVEMDELKIILKRAFHVARLEREYRELQETAAGDGSFEGMLGTSPQMEKVFSSIRKVAASQAPLLILGESGTGKERVALAVHRRSDRNNGPFVTINCGAIPESLLESELFGHEKGAFTGAHQQRKGRFEMAEGGTLFLDEIGELPAAIQVKLLRFLQEKTIERVGGRKEIAVNTRVLAATNADLESAIRENRFREDLYYRLAVVVVKVPPLAEREGDALLLAKAFLRKFAEDEHRTLSGFDRRAVNLINRYEWPGNVRELENRVKRAVIMAEKRQVTAEDLELGGSAAGYGGMGLKEAREALEKELVEKALARSKGKISQAATELGISRPTLYELMEKLGVKRHSN